MQNDQKVIDVQKKQLSKREERRECVIRLSSSF